MKAIDFANDLIDEGFFSDIDGDCFWSGDGFSHFDSSKRLEVTIEIARERGLTLTDVEELENEADTLFYEAYKCNSDKGLS